MNTAPERSIRITMTSDWHVGTGAGRPGELDQLVARDADGLPFLPAKTVTGIWRDACERIAYGLDGGAYARWSNWVNVIFGDEPSRREPGSAKAVPLRAVLSVRPARLPAPLRTGAAAIPSHPLARKPRAELSDEEQHQVDDWQARRQARERLRPGLTFAKPGVAIDEYTGRARDDFLRMEEMARGGLTLIADCELAEDGWDEPQRQTARALLVAGAKLIERLGGKRRRGTGKCSAEAVGFGELHDAIARLEDDPASSPEPPQQDKDGSGTAAAVGKGWERIPLKIMLKTPVVAASATVGNVVESLDHVPGSFLLPVIARALADADIDAAAEIAAGNVIVLPATPEIAGGRGLPSPLALHAPKGSETLSEAHNRFVEPDRNREWQEAPPRYVLSAAPGEEIPEGKLDTAATTHGTIDERAQRPTENVGGVFSYTAIPPSDRYGRPTVLRSEIRLRGEIAEKLGTGWTREARLGRSKKDDYGLVQVAALQPLSTADNDERRFALAAPGQPQVLYLWLLTDLLIRDQGLRLTSDPQVLRAVLARALKIANTDLCLGKAEGNETIGLALRARRYDGWQAQWGLPRPTLAGLQAGSCLRIEITNRPADLPYRLRKIENEGLGERRAEGFGQVRFNDPLLTEKIEGRKSWGPPPPELGNTVLLSPSSPEHAAAAVIEKAAWRKAIGEAAIRLALNETARRGALCFEKGRPGASQLGALRSQIAKLREPEVAPGAVRHWLANLRQHPKRAEQWGDSIARVDKLVSEQGEVWRVLDIGSEIDALTMDCRERLERELWAEAVQAVIGAAIRAEVFAAREVKSEERAHA